MGVEGVFLEPIPRGHQGMIAHIKIFVMTPSCALHPALYQFHFSFRPGRGEHMATRLKKTPMCEFSPSFKHSEKGISFSELFPDFPQQTTFLTK